MGALITTEAISSVVAYESMCRWITESESLADCKDIADKSAALKEYARRANNKDAERRACNVRLIAERRFGELLKEQARATPQTANPSGLAKPTPLPATGCGSEETTVVSAAPSPYAQALADTGTSPQAASRYQALASVPDEVFQEALSNPVVAPTIRGLIEKPRQPAHPTARDVVEQARAPEPKMPDDSLWLWGRMRDFERDGFFRKNSDKLISALTETMRADVARIAPLMVDFFTQIESATHELA